MKLPTIIVREDILRSWLKISDCSQSQLASSLGVSRGRVSQLFTTGIEPSAHLMAKLLVLTHLPFDRLFEVLEDARDKRVSVHRSSTPRHHQGDAVGGSARWRTGASAVRRKGAAPQGKSSARQLAITGSETGGGVEGDPT